MSGLAVAVAGAVAAGIVAGLLGVPLVLRDLSMFGFGLAHAAFGGVALALALSVAPLPVGVAFAMLGAAVIVGLRRGTGLREETVLAVVTLSGMGLGLLLVGLGGVPRPDIVASLFGTPLSADRGPALGIAALTLVGVVGFVLLEKEIFYATFDREAAALSGVPVRALDAGLLGLTALAVVVVANVAGLLLVGALLVLPSAAGLQVARTWRGSLVAASVAGAAVGAAGVGAAWGLGVDNGAPVVLAGVLALGVGAALGRLRETRGDGRSR